MPAARCTAAAIRARSSSRRPPTSSCSIRCACTDSESIEVGDAAVRGPRALEGRARPTSSPGSRRSWEVVARRQDVDVPPPPGRACSTTARRSTPPRSCSRSSACSIRTHPHYLAGEDADYWRSAAEGRRRAWSRSIGDTVEIHVARPYAPLLGNLAMFPIVSPTAVRRVGRRVQGAPGRHRTVRVRVLAAGRAASSCAASIATGATAPLLDRIVFRVVVDARQRLIDLESGSVDLATAILPDEQPFVELHPDLVLHHTPGNDVSYLAFNTQHAAVRRRCACGARSSTRSTRSRSSSSRTRAARSPPTGRCRRRSGATTSRRRATPTIRRSRSSCSPRRSPTARSIRTRPTSCTRRRRRARTCRSPSASRASSRPRSRRSGSRPSSSSSRIAQHRASVEARRARPRAVRLDRRHRRSRQLPLRAVPLRQRGRRAGAEHRVLSRRRRSTGCWSRRRPRATRRRARGSTPRCRTDRRGRAVGADRALASSWSPRAPSSTDVVLSPLGHPMYPLIRARGAAVTASDRTPGTARARRAARCAVTSADSARDPRIPRLARRRRRRSCGCGCAPSSSSRWRSRRSCRC